MGELRKIKLANGMYLVVDTEVYSLDEIQLPAPAEKTHDFYNETKLLDRATQTKFHLRITSITEAKVNQQREIQESYTQKLIDDGQRRHEKEHIDVSSRQQLLELAETSLMIMRPMGGETDTVVWGLKDNPLKTPSGRTPYYKEPFALYDDLVEWLKNSGYEEDLSFYMGSFSTFFHVERRAKQLQKAEEDRQERIRVFGFDPVASMFGGYYQQGDSRTPKRIYRQRPKLYQAPYVW